MRNIVISLILISIIFTGCGLSKSKQFNINDSYDRCIIHFHIIDADLSNELFDDAYILPVLRSYVKDNHSSLKYGVTELNDTLSYSDTKLIVITSYDKYQSPYYNSSNKRNHSNSSGSGYYGAYGTNPSDRYKAIPHRSGYPKFGR